MSTSKNNVITRAKELLAAATTGEWIRFNNTVFPRHPPPGERDLHRIALCEHPYRKLDKRHGENDAEFIAFARNHLAEIIDGYEKMSEAIDILLLLAMDEDNVWDLERANEVRIGIREYAIATLRKLGEME